MKKLIKEKKCDCCNLCGKNIEPKTYLNEQKIKNKGKNIQGNLLITGAYCSSAISELIIN